MGPIRAFSGEFGFACFAAALLLFAAALLAAACCCLAAAAWLILLRLMLRSKGQRLFPRRPIDLDPTHRTFADWTRRVTVMLHRSGLSITHIQSIINTCVYGPEKPHTNLRRSCRANVASPGLNPGFADTSIIFVTFATSGDDAPTVGVTSMQSTIASSRHSSSPVSSFAVCSACNRDCRTASSWK